MAVKISCKYAFLHSFNVCTNDMDNIHAEMKRLKNEGFVLLNEEPKFGAGNKFICFMHSERINGVLVEGYQEIKNIFNGGS